MCITLIIMFSSSIGLSIEPKPWGIHAGVWGLAANFLTVGITSIYQRMPVKC
jgi:hypothetical protein